MSTKVLDYGYYVGSLSNLVYNLSNYAVFNIVLNSVLILNESGKNSLFSGGFSNWPRERIAFSFPQSDVIYSLLFYCTLRD